MDEHRSGKACNDETLLKSLHDSMMSPVDVEVFLYYCELGLRAFEPTAALKKRPGDIKLRIEGLQEADLASGLSFSDSLPINIISAAIVQDMDESERPGIFPSIIYRLTELLGMAARGELDRWIKEGSTGKKMISEVMFCAAALTPLTNNGKFRLKEFRDLANKYQLTFRGSFSIPTEVLKVWNAKGPVISESVLRIVKAFNAQ